MSQLATAMHAKGKVVTAAVIAWGGDTIISSVFSSVDWLNIMDYDNTNGVGQSTYDSAVTALDYWVTQRGLPQAKAVLGVPFYGDPDEDYGYAQLLSMGASPNADSWNGYGYNGIPTIQQKTSLALKSAGGIMIWELSEDATGANSLLSAIHNVIASSNPFSGSYEIQCVASSLDVNVSGSSKTNGAVIIQYAVTGSSNSLWTFVPTSNGYYQIQNVNSGLDLVVQNASTANGGEIVQWSFGSSGNDQWKPQQNSDGTYTFLNLHSGLVLDDPGSSKASGIQFDQWTSKGSSNQKFNLVSP